MTTSIAFRAYRRGRPRQGQRLERCLPITAVLLFDSPDGGLWAVRLDVRPGWAVAQKLMEAWGIDPYDLYPRYAWAFAYRTFDGQLIVRGRGGINEQLRKRFVEIVGSAEELSEL